MPTDVTDESAVEEAVRVATAQPVTLRIAVSCAGIGWAGRVVGKRGAHELEPFETVIRVNLIGTFNVMRLAAAAMLETEPTAVRRAGRVHQHGLDRSLRRPDRADRLLGLEGRDRRA